MKIPIQIITSKRLETLEMAVVTLKAEVEKLEKVRKIADALRDKCISADDILTGKVHMRKTPAKKKADDERRRQALMMAGMSNMGTGWGRI